MELKRHPWNQIHRDYGVSCHIDSFEAPLRIGFQIRGDTASLMLEPASHNPVFRDEIWQSSCFELFVQSANETEYCEFNFAPNGDWAAYHFDDYRHGMKIISIKQPKIRVVNSDGNLDVMIALDNLAINRQNAKIGLCIILESPEGKSYWALKHCDNKPDFHQKHCFLHPQDIR